MLDWDAHIRAGAHLGGDHYLKFTYWTPDGAGITVPARDRAQDGWVLIGITESHKSLHPDRPGEWCGGYVNFKNVPEAALYDAKFGTESHHELVTEDPITVSPSLACRRCSSHGFIRGGGWVDA